MPSVHPALLKSYWLVSKMLDSRYVWSLALVERQLEILLRGSRDMHARCLGLRTNLQVSSTKHNTAWSGCVCCLLHCNMQTQCRDPVYCGSLTCIFILSVCHTGHSHHHAVLPVQEATGALLKGGLLKSYSSKAGTGLHFIHDVIKEAEVSAQHGTGVNMDTLSSTFNSRALKHASQ